MNKQKITQKDRKNIVARVNAGEKQKDLAVEYGVSKGYLSKIVKQSKERELSDVSVPQQMNMSRFTTDQLKNRYRTIHIELLRHNEELQQRYLEADALQHSIETESAKAAVLRDEGWILAQKKRLTWCQDTTRISYEMARLYQEASAILQTFAKRDVPVPVGPLIQKGLIPGARG